MLGWLVFAVIPLSGVDDWDFSGYAQGAGITIDAETSTPGSVHDEPPSSDPVVWNGSVVGEYGSGPGPSETPDPPEYSCFEELTVDRCFPDAGGTGESDEAETLTPEEIVSAIASQVESDVARLPVVPAKVRYQPVGGEVLVNMETIFYTEANPQYLSATLLDFPVTIEVVPVSFEWRFGDDSAPLRTTDSGAPYPNHTISHIYRSSGANVVSLNTTWDARFRVERLSGWIPVSGQPVTTDQVGPIESVTKRSRLVHMGED